MRVEVEPDTLPAGLRTGQFGTVAIALADYPAAIMLPASVLVTGEKPAVMIVADGKAARREITIGLNDGDRAANSDGIAVTLTIGPENCDEECPFRGADATHSAEAVYVASNGLCRG